MHHNLSYKDKMIFFSGQGPMQPLHHTPRLDTYGASTPPYWNPKYATVLRSSLDKLWVTPQASEAGLQIAVITLTIAVIYYH